MNNRLSSGATNAPLNIRESQEVVSGINSSINMINGGIDQSSSRGALKNSQVNEQRHEWFRREILPLEPKLRAYLRRLTHSKFDVDDLVQDAFTRILVYENWVSVKTPHAFVITIARNLVFDELRRQKVVAIRFLPDLEVLGRSIDSPGPEATLLACDALNLLLKIIAELSPQCRRVFTLRKVYGLPPCSIADQLGLSVSTVEKHLVKALRLCTENYARSGEEHIKDPPRKLWPMLGKRVKEKQKKRQEDWLSV